MSCPELVVQPSSTVTSASASPARWQFALPVADPAYLGFLEAVYRFAEADYVLQRDWTETPQAAGVHPLFSLAAATQAVDPAASLRALTDQLRRGALLPVAPEIRELADQVVAESAESGDDIDDWARTLGKDVAEADD